MREFEPDTEVLADLQLRNESMHDRSRTRGRNVYSWTQPEFVGVWGCRRPGCARLVSITQDGIDYSEQCDEWLVARGQEKLGRSKISYCDACLAEYKRTAPDRRRKQIEEMAVKIRELKESRDPHGERDCIDALARMGHPDIEGLVQALSERRATERASSSRKKGF